MDADVRGRAEVRFDFVDDEILNVSVRQAETHLAAIFVIVGTLVGSVMLMHFAQSISKNMSFCNGSAPQVANLIG